MSWDRLLRDLEAEKAVSERTFRRRYHGGSTRVEPPLFWREALLPEGRRGQRWARFVVHKDALRAAPETLRHFAGLAEMRDALGAPLEEWRLLDFDSSSKPDALWGDAAIEYDAGEYSRQRVIRKMRAFADAYPRQVWGAPTPARKTHLRKLARELGLVVDVIEARWF